MHDKQRIDRYVAGELSPASEEDVRKHLSGCAECRYYFHEQTVLFRALSGDLGRATAAEEARLLRRVLLGVVVRVKRGQETQLRTDAAPSSPLRYDENRDPDCPIESLFK